MPTSLMIRSATLEDAAEIARVHVAAWRAAYAGRMPDDFLRGLSVDSRRRAWERQLGEGDGDVLVAVHEGAVAGFALIGPSRDDDAGEGTGELHAINLDPPHWSRGVGGLLHDRAVAALRARGFRDATLWVLGSNDRARRFYAKAGWSPDGTTRVETIGGAALTEVRYRRSLGD